MMWSFLCGGASGAYVAQFSECESEWGATLGVVKTCSYFWFCCGGDHVFYDGSDIDDNTSGKAGAQIPHLPLRDDASPCGR
jgi:hypothetical protein